MNNIDAFISKCSKFNSDIIIKFTTDTDMKIITSNQILGEGFFGKIYPHFNGNHVIKFGISLNQNINTYTLNELDQLY